MVAVVIKPLQQQKGIVIIYDKTKLGHFIKIGVDIHKDPLCFELVKVFELHRHHIYLNKAMNY